MLARERKKYLPRVPDSLAELGKCLKLRGSKILQGIVQSSKGNTAVIFSSPDLLNDFKDAQQSFMDGTFDVSLPILLHPNTYYREIQTNINPYNDENMCFFISLI